MMVGSRGTTGSACSHPIKECERYGSEYQWSYHCRRCGRMGLHAGELDWGSSDRG